MISHPVIIVFKLYVHVMVEGRKPNCQNILTLEPKGKLTKVTREKNKTK